MKIKGIIFEDFVNYKTPCMTIEMPYCTFKCDKECGRQVCQNSPLALAENITVSPEHLACEYVGNPISKALCFQGLEPFDSFDDMWNVIYTLRKILDCNDDVVIYTGYNEDEIQEYIKQLKKFNNIVVKFGRFIPNAKHIYDEVLGVELSSYNQYAKRIS